ncbi:MAG: R2-like ligand-binding oxidase [Candidatus Dormibacteraeota bacterium]|nr:R2-like ligand-binding oxidase [Candidatus Dormibacteraeota bacterium]
MATRSTYLSISRRGIDFASVPMRLFQKSKKLGVWDPMSFDLNRDREDWLSLSPARRDDLLGTTTLFQAGEEAVTIDLLPLVMAVARRGLLEEEIYLTSFLWEEAKHTEFFRRWLDDVPRVSDEDLHDRIGPNYQRLFFEELPATMGRLLEDESDEALTRALTTYNMIVEGVLAETGYHSYARQLEAGRLFPGLAAALKLISRDESRHIRFGVYMLQRLIQADGRMWGVVQERMGELMPIVLGIVGPPPGAPPLPGDSAHAADPDEMTRFAMTQYQRRMKVLERARGQSRTELEQEVSAELTRDFSAG